VTEPIRSGQELLTEFFRSVKGIEGVDPETAAVVTRLWEEGKLTATNITNELASLRDKSDGEDHRT
jgi:hypothetical protein